MSEEISAADILQAYAPYRDDWGLVHDKKDSISGNGIRYTAEMVASLHRFNCLEQFVDGTRLWLETYSILSQCLRTDYPILIRHPKNPNSQEGPDDYVAFAMAMKLMKFEWIAGEILDYGNEHNWVFNNTTKLPFVFSMSAFIGRQSQIITHYYYAAGKTPPLFYRWYWVGAILFSAFFTKKTNQDGWVLSWMLVKTAKDVSPFVNFIRSIWIWRFKAKHPGGVGGVLADYFNDDSHPSSVFLKGEFGE